MAIDDQPADFEARITIVSGAGGGPVPDSFALPVSGRCSVPMRLDGIDGYWTVQIRGSENTVLRKGESANVECALLIAGVASHLKTGAEFELWANSVFAKGTITKKYQESGVNLVDCDIWLENAEGQKTTPGTATVALPSRGS